MNTHVRDVVEDRREVPIGRWIVVLPSAERLSDARAIPDTGKREVAVVCNRGQRLGGRAEEEALSGGQEGEPQDRQQQQAGDDSDSHATYSAHLPPRPQAGCMMNLELAF